MRKLLILFLLFGCFKLRAKEVIQFSGFVHDVATNAPLPFCAIFIQGENRGTITDLDGYFNFVVGKGDTILVTSVGYKKFKIIVPEDLDKSSFYKEIRMERDVMELPGVTIRPLPTPAQLRHAMINLDIPDNMQQLAQQAIEQSILTDAISRKMNYSGSENYNQYVQQQVGYYYNRYGNQRPGISLTNPFAWAQFIKSIKDKKKKKK